MSALKFKKKKKSMVWNESVWEEDLVSEVFIFNWPEIENAGLRGLPVVQTPMLPV